MIRRVKSTTFHHLYQYNLMNRTALGVIVALLLCFYPSTWVINAQVDSNSQQAYQILYQHAYTSEGTYRSPQCDTTELLLTPTASRYGLWRRDELFATLKAEKAGIIAAKPKSVITVMAIEMLRTTLSQAGIDLQLKHLRPWFVTGETEQIYKSIESDSLSLVDDLDKKGIITYTMPRIQYEWVESNEVEEVLGYTCKKATAVVDGRTWTAWYCEDLPFDNGPDKFAGLPGLILRLSDNQGTEYRAIGFKQMQLSVEAVNRPNKARVVKERDYQDLRTSDRNERRYYLFGADGNIYFIYMDRPEYDTLLAQEK